MDVGRNRESSTECLTDSRFVVRPIDIKPLCEDLVPRNRPPVAAVPAMLAVIAHGEVLFRRDSKFVVVNVLKNFVRPFGLHAGLQIFGTVRREVVPERFRRRGGGGEDVWLAPPLPAE